MGRKKVKIKYAGREVGTPCKLWEVYSPKWMRRKRGRMLRKKQRRYRNGCGYYSDPAMKVSHDKSAEWLIVSTRPESPERKMNYWDALHAIRCGEKTDVYPQVNFDSDFLLSVSLGLTLAVKQFTSRGW